MARTLAVLTLVTLGVVASYAGQIQLGQTVDGVNVGLTTLYMTTPNAVTSTAGCANGCVNGSTTGFSLKNYDKNMFATGTPNPTPFSGYSNTTGVASTQGSTMFDSAHQVTFAMLSQTGSNGNFWAAGGNNTLTIPVGVFGVQNVWTMLNNYFGKDTNNDTNVTFTFDNNKDGSDAASKTVLTVDLVNGKEVRAGFDCTANCGSWVDYSTGLAASTSVTGSGLQCAGNCPALVTVVTNNIFSSTGITGGAGTNVAGATGTAVLDDQGFLFGSMFSNQYLVSIGVTQKNFATGIGLSGGNLASISAVSAVTLDTFDRGNNDVATPEPSTVLMLLGGFSALGFARLRRRQ